MEVSSLRQRLQKVMAHAGLGSRRRCEQWIVSGRVQVNGQICTELGTKVDPGSDRILVDGRPLPGPEPNMYVMLHKPKNVICTVKDDKGRPTVMDCLGGLRRRVYPVGRLDGDSEGLLLLTNDGFLSHRLLHPSYHVPKTYRVTVKGRMAEEALAALRDGIALEDGVTAPARVDLVDQTPACVVDITLWEGRNRQVRRMFDAVQHPVVRLVRRAVGPLALGELRPGQFRYLETSEIDALYEAVDHGRT